MPRAHPELISPTAHYTGTVWLQHGLSHPAFATLQGQAFYYALKAPMAVAKRLGLPSVKAHRLIARAVAEGRISLARHEAALVRALAAPARMKKAPGLAAVVPATQRAGAAAGQAPA